MKFRIGEQRIKSLWAFFNMNCYLLNIRILLSMLLRNTSMEKRSQESHQYLFFFSWRLLRKCYSCAKIQFCLWWCKDDTVLSVKLVLPWVRTFWHQTRLKRTDGCRNIIKKKKRKKKLVSKHQHLFPWIFPERSRKEVLKRLDHLIHIRFYSKINTSNTWIIKKSQMLNMNLDIAKWSL